jgi:antitoxin ParD1/3/4
MNISLTPKLEELVNEKVKSGMYTSASEVIRQGLRLLAMFDEQQEVKLKALRAAIQEGFDSGEATEWDFEDFKKKARTRLKTLSNNT